MADGIGDKLIAAAVEAAKQIVKGFGMGLPTLMKDKVKKEFIGDIMNPDRFKTPEVQEIVKALRTEFSNSPDTLTDIGSDILEGIIGLVAKLQFQSVAKIDVDADMPHTDAVFIQMAIITDVNLLLALLGIITEVMSLGQIDKVADEIRSYLDYSGLSQMSSTGYGLVLGVGLTPLIEKEILQKTQPNIYDEPTTIRLKFRKFIDDAEMLDNMQKLGYPDEKTTNILNSAWFYPAPTDFIRFAVREVFREEIVEKYGYDEAFPIDEAVPKEMIPDWLQPNLEGGAPTLRDLIEVGMLDESTLRWYWRAHWELPSPNMGYEMLHRQLITEEELTTLLKIQDFAPYWIDKMIGISYSPYTRVDARRMHELGTLNDDEYVTALREIGYPQDKAEKMLEWTILRKMAPERDLTRTMIMKSFTTGLKDRKWAIENLELLGYDIDEAELIVGLKEYDQEEDDLKDQIDLHSLRYVSGLTTKEEMTAALDGLGLNELRKTRLMTAADTKKSKQISLPSKSDLLGWFAIDLIKEPMFRDRMLQLGFLNDDIDIYIAEVTAEKLV